MEKSVLITGASKGLGAALAGELAGAGARVVMVARHADELEKAAARIGAYALPADIGDKHAVHAIAGAAAALVGPIDILIHNASTLGPTPLRLLLDTECEDFEQVLQTNLIGPFRLTRIVAGAMARAAERALSMSNGGGGGLRNVSSDALMQRPIEVGRSRTPGAVF